MFKSRSIQSSLSIKDKIVSIDYILVFSIFKIIENKIIITGTVEIISTPVITCVVFKE